MKAGEHSVSNPTRTLDKARRVRMLGVAPEIPGRK